MLKIRYIWILCMIFNRLAHSLFFSSLLISCQHSVRMTYGQQISTEQADITSGELIFQQHCSPCHNFRQHGIGPQLGGLTKEVSTEWIIGFIKNPSQLIDAKDQRAHALFVQFGTRMPSYSMLSDEEINLLLAYMHSFEKPDDPTEQVDLPVIDDPVPAKVPMSDLVCELELVTQMPASSAKSPLARINKMDAYADRLFVSDLRGQLYELRNGHPYLYMDLTQLRSSFVDRPGLGTGLGSFAFHPDFAINGLLYTTHSEAPGSGIPDEKVHTPTPVAIQYVLMEWQVEDPFAKSFSGEGRELLRMDMVTGKHGFQEIAFNPYAKKGASDYGMLYVTIGDGGSVEDGYPEYSHHQGTKFWSTILRIDPKGNNSKNGKYGIPADNPFVDDQEKRPEIFAYGFRNPNQLSWDHNGNLYATDIGLRQIEEINAIHPGSYYGWPIREGAFFLNHQGNMSRVYELPKDDTAYHITYPTVSLDHDDLRAIIGGYFYNDNNIQALNGTYLFGDITSGRLFYTSQNDMQVGRTEDIFEWRIWYEGELTTLSDLCDCRRVDLRFGQDGDGQLYLMTKADGKIYKLTKNVEVPVI